MLARLIIIFIASISHDIKLVSGKVKIGHLVTRDDWVFLDRFCFLSMDGLFRYEILYDYDPKEPTPSLLMYPDLQWENAYKNPKAKTCRSKLKVLRPEMRQIIPLDVHSLESGCEIVYKSNIDLNSYQSNNNEEDEGNETSTTSTTTTTTPNSVDIGGNYKRAVLCKNARSFATARERWWFIAVSNCNGTKGLDIKYKFRMTNGRRGDYWYEHFSADEFYILPCLTSFCFTYIFLLFTSLIFAVELKCRQLFHITYKLFLSSLGIQCLGLICLCIAYARYGSNGDGFPTLKLIGRILEATSEFFFILLLLLLAKGFTVTRGRLRLPSAIKLTIFLCCYGVIYTFLFFFEQYFFDPGYVLYIYESPAGYGLLILRLLGWLMFFYSVFFTLKHFPEKGGFYLPFFLIYSLWFISGPIIIIISNHVIDKWVREKTSVIVEHFCFFIGHLIFLFLTRPSAANKSFPYHVRTTQVGADLSASSEPLDRFDSHSYAPSYTDAAGRIMDIFTVTGVLQRMEGTGSPMDVFSATNNNGESPVLPAVYKAPPPKYADVFPHEEPGEVAEMLKETEYENENDSDSINSQLEDSAAPNSREKNYEVK